MAIRDVTILDMAKKKPPGRPKGRKPTYVVYARIKPEIGAQIEAFLDTTKPTTTLVGLLELALEEFFERRQKAAQEEET